MMVATAERMRAMRERRRSEGLREVRLLVPDVRAEATKLRVATQVLRLSKASEVEALEWVEQVSEFDEAR
jgi:ribosomal protein L28